MTIGIIGGTTLAGTLGNRLIAKGVNVVFGVREEFNYQPMEWKILQWHKRKVMGYCEAMAEADIILLCCENQYLSAVCDCFQASEVENKLDKLVVDCTNGQLKPELGSNTAYIIRASGHQNVVKAFNNLGLDYPHSDPLGLIRETYYCGDEPTEKFRVKRLIELLGFKGIDAGRLENASLLEAVYHLRNEISMMTGEGNDCQFGLMSV